MAREKQPACMKTARKAPPRIFKYYPLLEHTRIRKAKDKQRRLQKKDGDKLLKLMKLRTQAKKKKKLQTSTPTSAEVLQQPPPADVELLFNSNDAEEGGEEREEVTTTTISAHKSVLSQGSAVFAAMFATTTAAADMVEARTGQVRVELFSPQLMRLVLRFLYNEQPLLKTELQDNARELYEVADFYQIKELMEMAKLALLIRASRALMVATTPATAKETKKLASFARIHQLTELQSRLAANTV